MKIRKKITLIFISFTGSLMFCAFSLIYLFFYRYTEKEFIVRLEERANIVAQSYLEKDELNSNIYDKIRQQHFQILPNEKESIFQVEVSTQRILKGSSTYDYPDNFLQEIFQKKRGQFQTGEVQHVGILYRDNEGDFIVIASAVDRYGQTKLLNLRSVMGLVFLIGLLGIYFVGELYAGKVLDPISAITEKAKSISFTKLNIRLNPGKNKDELSELAVTFNNMLDRLETAFDIQTNFVNNASHELKNPLTAILGEIEITLNKERSTDEYKTSLQAIEIEAQRLSLLVNTLLSLAQSGSDKKGLTFESVRIDELLIEVKHGIDNINPENDITFNFEELPVQSDLLLIHGNSGLLRLAFSNILGNACKFSLNKEVVIKVTASDGFVHVYVTDQGIGIPTAELSNITEPFYRASNARSFNGFGVGLPLSYKIIKLHQGTIVVSSEEMRGTEVKISIPKHV